MAITIDGSSAAGNIDLGTNGTITDLAVGGLPDGTVDGDTLASTIPASKLTGDLPAISGANLTGISSAGSFRNLIDNGAFKIAQRGTSKTGITDTGRYVFDRWRTEVAHDGGYGTYTLTQESSTSLPDGHTNSYKLQVTTADAVVGTNDLVTIYTTIEAQNLVRLRYGTSDALTTTLSFWVRTNLENKTGFVMLYKNDNAERMVCKSYTTHGTANTWKKVTLTFPGDTTGAINNDNGGGVALQWFLCAGATQSVDPPTSWANYNSSAKCKGTDIQIASSTNNYYELTGVQWEIGSTATDYEHRTIADELRTCQRYYQRYGSPKTFKQNGSGGFVDCTVFAMMLPYDGDDCSGGFPLPVEMRTTPSLSGTDSNGGGDYIRIQSVSDDFNGGNFFQINNSSPQFAGFHIDTPDGLETDRQAGFYFNSTAGYFALDAEL